MKINQRNKSIFLHTTQKKIYTALTILAVVAVIFSQINCLLELNSILFSE